MNTLNSDFELKGAGYTGYSSLTIYIDAFLSWHNFFLSPGSTIIADPHAWKKTFDNKHVLKL